MCSAYSLGVNGSTGRALKSRNVVVDLSETGEITGIELLKASVSFKRDIPAVISNARKRE